jgi:hypothetical protein
VPKFTIIAKPIFAKPKDFPVNKLKNIRRDLERYLRFDAGPMLIGDLNKTVANWRGKPTFVQKYSEPRGNMQLDVFPTGKNTLKWKRVSEGTGPRIITAKPGKMMVFPRNYTPKTTPRGRYGGPGRKSGPIQKALTVMHEIEPRKFTIIIKEKREDQIERDINKILFKGA